MHCARLMAQASKDGVAWLVLLAHDKDTSLQAPGTTATWPVEAPPDPQGWRHFRVRMTGPNSGNTHILSLSGWEIYGAVRGVLGEVFAAPSAVAEERSVRRQRAMSRVMAARLAPGMRVTRGPDWKWGSQNGDVDGTLALCFVLCRCVCRCMHVRLQFVDSDRLDLTCRTRHCDGPRAQRVGRRAVGRQRGEQLVPHGRGRRVRPYRARCMHDCVSLYDVL